MQIAMRRSSDIEMVDRIFSPHEDTGFRTYLRDRFEKTMDYLEKASTSVSKKFVERAKDIFEASNSFEALRRTRNAVRAASNVRKSSIIFEAVDIDDFRTAGFTMQRFLMADPIVRSKYHRQKIDGYSETYIDIHPNDIGTDHYDYRRVIDGVIREEKDEKGEVQFVREVFYEELSEGDRDLDAVEQLAILDSWDIQRMFIEAGIDSTNRLGGVLG